MKDGYNWSQSKTLFSTPSTQTSLTFHVKPLHFKDGKKDALCSLSTKCINWHNYLTDPLLLSATKCISKEPGMEIPLASSGFLWSLTLSNNKSLKVWGGKQWFYMESLSINWKTTGASFDRKWMKFHMERTSGILAVFCFLTWVVVP